MTLEKRITVGMGPESPARAPVALRFKDAAAQPDVLMESKSRSHVDISRRGS